MDNHSSKEKFTKLSQTIRTIRTDWLIDNIISDKFINQPSPYHLEGVYVHALLYLSEIVLISDLANEELGELQIVDLVLEYFDKYSNKFSTTARELHQHFLSLRGWLQNGKPNVISEFGSFVLLRVVDYNLDTETDSSVAFHCINKAKEGFNNLTSITAQWGHGLSRFQHARFIKTDNDIAISTMEKLLKQANDKMRIALKGRKTEKSCIAKYFLNRCYYTMARLNALLYTKLKDMNSLNLFFFHLLKAKLGDEYQSLDPFKQGDFKELVKDPEFIEIMKESLPASRERLAFDREIRKYQSLHGVTLPENQQPLDASLTESVIMRNALSFSTFQFLSQANDFGLPVNLLSSFFPPVISPLKEEARIRLEERMRLYGVEARREIPGDGNCQMYSLSDQLFNTLKYAKFIRKRLLRWLRAHGSLQLPNGACLKDFVHEQPWDVYCAGMDKEGTWGDHLTLTAAAETFSTRIVIISSIPNNNYMIEINPELSTAKNTIMLSHFAEFHYGSVHPINDQ